jgi:hypothetical protein
MVDALCHGCSQARAPLGMPRSESGAGACAATPPEAGNSVPGIWQPGSPAAGQQADGTAARTGSACALESGAAPAASFRERMRRTWDVWLATAWFGIPQHTSSFCSSLDRSKREMSGNQQERVVRACTSQDSCGSDRMNAALSAGSAHTLTAGAPALPGSSVCPVTDAHCFQSGGPSSRSASKHAGSSGQRCGEGEDLTPSWLDALPSAPGPNVNGLDCVPDGNGASCSRPGADCVVGAASVLAPACKCHASRQHSPQPCSPRPSTAAEAHDTRPVRRADQPDVCQPDAACADDETREPLEIFRDGPVGSSRAAVGAAATAASSEPPSEWLLGSPGRESSGRDTFDASGDMAGMSSQGGDDECLTPIELGSFLYGHVR